MEEARIVLRQAREAVKNKIEAAMVAKEISEDDKFRFIKELDEFLAQISDNLAQTSEELTKTYFSHNNE